MLGGRMKTHGMSGTKIYDIWSAMLARCRNKKNKDFPRYGGRGIKVDNRWLKFENFYADMGERPEGLSLDRKYNDKGYSKANCRWATAKEQNDNSSNNVLLRYKGRTMNVTNWERELGFRPFTLFSRLRNNWSVERTLSTRI